MRGIRGEPVEVWLRDGRPARFVWRGRMYTVMFVLDRQVAPAGTAADPDPAASGPASSGNANSGTANSGTANSGTASSGTGGSEYWRVEATPERSVPPATYELCRDVASGRWRLSRS
jgi:hypothetical protein